MLGELAERVGPRGAFRATEEGHGEICDEKTVLTGGVARLEEGGRTKVQEGKLG